jgi:hypothetical protein
MNRENPSSRRQFLKSAGLVTAGLAATVPASARKVAESSGDVSTQLHEGQRVTDGNDDGTVAVFNTPDADDFDQLVEGGPNDPYGTTQSDEVYDSGSNEYFIEVSWDYSGVTGWTPRPGLSPVSVPI